MTLSLDEVRSIRFPLARKPNEDGYRASSVDKFMDELEVSYAALTEQAEKGGDDSSAAGADDTKLKELSGQIDDLTGNNEKLNADLQRITADNEQLRGQLNELRTSGGRDSAAKQQLTTENEHLRNELEGLRTQLAEAQEQAAKANQAPAAPVAAPVVSADGEQHITVTASAEAGAWAARLLEMSTQQADQLVAEARAQADSLLAQGTADSERMRSEAKTKAEAMVEEATQKAARLDYESRNNAERITGDAQRRANNLDSEVAAKRSELFSGLETKRDALAERIKALRSFESDYRSSIKAELESTMSRFSKLSLSPEESENGTPRLHALLEDRKGE